MSDLDGGGSDIEGGEDDGAGMEELQMIMAIQIQKRARGMAARMKVERECYERYEKIWDPRRDEFYFYDKELDLAAWKLPKALSKFTDSFPIAPTFLPEDAALVIQTMARRVAAAQRLRLVYKEQWEEVFDFYSGNNYYANRKTYQSAWVLPGFMKGKYDYTPKDPNQPDEDEGDEGEEGEGKGDEESEIDSRKLSPRRRLWPKR